MQNFTWGRVGGFLLVIFLLFVVSALLVNVWSVQAESDDVWQNYDDYEVIDHDTTWSGSFTQADIQKPVVVVNGATLTIEQGTRVTLGHLSVYDGRIVAEGTENEKITFTKLAPDFSSLTSDFDQYDRECFLYLFPEGTVEFSDLVATDAEEPSIFRNVVFEGMGSSVRNDGENCPSEVGRGKVLPFFIPAVYAGSPIDRDSPVLLFYSGRLRIESSEFRNSAYADIETQMWFSDEYEAFDFLEVADSNFYGSAVGGAALVSNFDYGDPHDQDYSGRVLLRNNWYGTPDGPMAPENPTGTGKRLVGTYRLAGWSATEHGVVTICADCASNVLFLPGIKASRLYKDGALGTDDQLWLPMVGSNDTEELAMDGDGESVEDVYTKDVLEGVGIPFVGGDLYASFLDQLSALKEDGTIGDYDAFAYDWRHNVEDIVRDGTLYPDNAVKSVADVLNSLAQSSKNGKVTIVAHSNGGLLAKALMIALEDAGKADLVDHIVFVGTPQMGTPLAILSMLYGYDEPIPALLSQSEARELAEHMPGAYGLLPSEKYFDRSDDPFVVFSSENTRYRDFKSAYGDAINSYGEFKAFLSGEGDGRSEPDADDTELENTLREKFLNQSEAMHDRFDHWVPPAGVAVIQIAGWGLDTVSGVEYQEKEKTQCYSIGGKVPSCTGIGEYEPYYDPKFTVDGDKTVVAPSALAMPEAENVKRYWVDLNGFNDNTSSNRRHRDLLEINPIIQFLSNIITKSQSTSLPEYISVGRPDDFEGASSRLRMSLYSPLDIHLYDDDGHHTGPKTVNVDGHDVVVFEEGIPNSSYYQFGDRKYVGVPSDEHIRVTMDGYDTGSYTLKLEAVRTTEQGEETIAHTTFADLPVTPEAEVTLDIPETGIENLSVLEADLNGDAQGGEYAVEPVPNGTATLDVIPPTTVATLSGAEGTHGWYVGDVLVVLSATDTVNGSGVEKTEYSFDNGAIWQEYAEPLTFVSEGTTTLLYRSSDKAGNSEERKVLTVKIDKAAPEAKVLFNVETQQLAIQGRDNLSGDVSVEITHSVIPNVDERYSSLQRRVWIDRWFRRTKEQKSQITATLTDEAGHKTELVFENKQDNNRRIDLVLESLAYDGMKTDTQDTTVQYKWLLDWRKQKYRLFASHLRTGGSALESHYFPKRDETWIMERPRELGDDNRDDDAAWRPKRMKLTGMVVPYLETDGGAVNISY